MVHIIILLFVMKPVGTWYNRSKCKYEHTSV